MKTPLATQEGKTVTGLMTTTRKSQASLTRSRKHSSPGNNTKSRQKKQSYKEAKSEVQTKIRELKNRWFRNKAEEIQHLADSNNPHEFFKATKVLNGPSKQGLAPLQSKDGTEIFKDKNAIISRCQEHFSTLFNCNAVVDASIFSEIPQHSTTEDLAGEPTILEVAKAVKQMKENKASGLDQIPAEIYKHGGQRRLEHLRSLMARIWNDEDLPNELKDAIIVHVFKKVDE